MTVSVLTISHRHGTDITVYAERSLADAALLEFVDAWWADEMGDAEPPEDPDQRIAAYFDEMIENEEWSIVECEVVQPA